MSPTAEAIDTPSRLRERALAQLRAGLRPGAPQPGTPQALSVLHQLASSPATAGDALALLHELQVHQVELELQQEELRQSRLALEAALIRQTDLVARAPAGYLGIDARTVLHEINPAGERLLGAPREALLGQPLTRWLTPRGAGRLHALLVRARDGLAPETAELQLLPVDGAARTLLVSVAGDTMPGGFLLALMPPAPASPA